MQTLAMYGFSKGPYTSRLNPTQQQEEESKKAHLMVIQRPEISFSRNQSYKMKKMQQMNSCNSSSCKQWRLLSVTPTDHTIYTCTLEHISTGNNHLWQVKQRYRTFEELQNDLLLVLSFPHCQYCQKVHERLQHWQTNKFPQKQLPHWLMSTAESKQLADTRAEAFHQYITLLLQIVSSPCYTMCCLVAKPITLLVYKFLTENSIKYKEFPESILEEEEEEEEENQSDDEQQPQDNNYRSSLTKLKTIYEIDT